MYAGTAFSELVHNLLALAGAADTPPMVVYGIFRAWVSAYETMWEDYGVDPKLIAELQRRSEQLARALVKDLAANPPIIGKFPDELPDFPKEAPP